MDAAPILARIAELLERYKLEAILVDGGGETDLKFLFRKTRTNLTKLKGVARDLDAVIYRPIYPVPDMFRLWRDSDGLQVDFTVEMDAHSFNRLLSRSPVMQFGGASLSVALSADIMKLVQAWRSHLRKRRLTRKERLALLKKESELADIEMIRRWQALPPERRTNFLRKRIGVRSSCL
jgi:hypothetical protein